MSDDQRPPQRLLIPIENLRIPRSWRIGRVTLHPGSEGEKLLGSASPFDSEDDLLRDRVFQILRSAESGVIAEICGGAAIDEAIDAVRSSLDALRLFQYSRSVSQTTAFGLPGDLGTGEADAQAAAERTTAAYTGTASAETNQS